MSETGDSLNSAAQRARRYLDADGLSYLLLGIAVISFVAALRPGYSWLTVVPLTICGSSGNILDWIRRRVVYPRLGYAYLPSQVTKLQLAHVLIASPILLLALFASFPSFQESRITFFSWLMPFSVLLALLGGLILRRVPQAEYALIFGLVLLGLLVGYLFHVPRSFPFVLTITATTFILIGLARFALFVTRRSKLAETRS